MDEWLKLFLSDVPLTPAPGDALTEEEALKVALREAFRGYGFTTPNPAVGCVLLDRDGKFLASGFHSRAGEPHAEIIALSGLAGECLPRSGGEWDLSKIPIESLRGAHAFVTLEPCAHEGRTPSCAKTLAKLPLGRVTFVLRDPNPLVAGKGIEILRSAGIRVRCLEDEGAIEDQWLEAARAVCEFFLVNFEQKRSFVSLKVATSLDGIMALKNGESQWITSASTRDFSRFLRGAHEACLVGRQTVIKDNPRLDARETPFADLPRALVVLDSKGEILSRPDLQIFKTHPPEKIFVCVGPEANTLSSSHAQVLRMRSTVYKDFLAEVLDKLWEREIRSVWIEGGATTLSAALEAGIGDRLWLFQGPHLLGASHGRPWTESWGVAQMKDRRTLAGVRHLSLGHDHLTTGRMTQSKS